MKNLNRTPVKSNNLKSVGYDGGTNSLEIEFNDNSVYLYFDVPQNVHEGLMAASSKNQYHAKFIKNRYRYQKI